MNFFKEKKYEPSIHEEIVSNYSNNKYYVIKEWDWGYDDNKKSIKVIKNKIICNTLNDFNREIWDKFHNLAEKYTYSIVFGPFGLDLENPYKPSIGPFYDGSSIVLIRREFMECVNEKSISRFLSCLIHFNYGNFDFEVLDK